MESEEANGGDLIPPATSNPNEESPDPTSAKSGHHAISTSVEMSAEQPASAEGAQISIGQDSLSPLSTGESAKMHGRYSHPPPAELGQGMSDLRQQQGLSEWEKDPAVQESPDRWDPSLNSDQGKLAHPESNQYFSFPSRVPQASTTPDKSPQVQSPAFHFEFSQNQEQALACHAAVPQSKHKGTSVIDSGPGQKEPTTAHSLMWEEVSEVLGKTETLPDETAGHSPLQGPDVANMTTRELLPLTDAAAGTNKEPSSGIDSVGTADPILSVDNGEKAGGLQRGNTASSSSQRPPYPLSDDSQGDSWPTGGNAGGKMLLSFHKTGKNALATDQKTDVAARQSPSDSINLPEEKKERDHGRAEGNTESPEKCVFQIRNTAKNTEQEKWQQEQLERDEQSAEEKQAEQEEPKTEKLEKEVKPAQEEPVLKREDQKEKRWDELDQEPAKEEAGLEAPPPAPRPGSPSLTKHNWDLHNVGESTSSAEGAGLPSPPQKSFSNAQHPGEDTLSSIVLKACTGEESVRAQPPALIMSEGLNPEDGSSMMPSPTYHFSEHWGETRRSGPSSCISINSQDCGETNPDDRASIGDGGHNDSDRRTVQISDNGEAISLVCRGVTLSPSPGNPASPRTLDPSFGAMDLGSLGPAYPHPVAENPAFPIHHDFTPASSSELNSIAGPSHEDANEGSPMSPAGCTDMDKAPSSVEKVSSQTSPDLKEADSGEGASMPTSTVCVQTLQGLVTSEKSLNEEPSAQPSISKAFRSPSPMESLPKDRNGVELTPTGPPTVHLVPPEPPDMAPPPLHQNPPTGSFVFQGKEMEASMVHAVEQESSFDLSHLNLEVEEPATGHAFNSVAQPPKEVPIPEPSSPLDPMPEASQLNQPPEPELRSPVDAVSEASQINHPLEPEPSSPLDSMPEASQLNQSPAPEPHSPQDAMSEASQLNHPLEPEPSSPLDSMPEASQLNHPPDPELHSPLDAMSEASQLSHPLEPEPSAPLDPMLEASQLNQPPAPPSSSPLFAMSKTGQINHSLEPEPSTSLDPMPEASQLSQPPATELSSPLDAMSEASQLNQPPAPEQHSPLDTMSEASQLNHPLDPELHSPLDAMSEASQLSHPLEPEPSAPLDPMLEASQLNQPPAPPSSSPLDAMSKTSQINHSLEPEPSTSLDPMPEASQLNQPPATELSSPLDAMSEASQLNQPPASDPSSPLAPMPDANQLNHPPAPEPSLPLAPVPKASHILKPLSLVSDSSQPPVPAPDIDQPLLSVSNSNPPLDCTQISSQLQASAPAPASVPAANSLVHTIDSAPDVEDGVEKLPLMQMTKEGVTGVQWNPIISFTQDVVDSNDPGVTLLAKSSDFPTLENEAPMDHSDNSLKVTGQYTDTHYGKSPPDHISWPSLGGWRTSTDSQSRNLVQPPSGLAFSNPIHFLQFSPPSPPTIRKLYRQEAVFEEPQWDHTLAGPTRVDTRKATAPVEMIETAKDAQMCSQRTEGQGDPLLVQETRHAPLEKSSSWPDRKVTRVNMKELGLSSGNQENPIKHRAKSKDWHRQGLRKVSVNLQEEGPHKDQPASSGTVILREKKSVDTWESLGRRHSKLINSSKLLYQEYSDVALNKAIQSQKRADILEEDIELSSPSSPRLRRKVLPSQDSYLQRLSVSSTASLWQDIPKVRGSRILLNMSRDDQKLQETKFELIMSEASYLRSLNVAVDHFQCSSELQALLTNQERKWLFSRLQDVHDVSASFLFDLEEKFEENMFTFNVCDVTLRHTPEFRRVYLPYVTNQTYQEQTFQRLLNGNARFQQVLERLESDTVCQRRSLKSFLILPFQRITRLKLLLQNILKRTPPESDEEVQATQAYDALEKLIKDCNENVQRMKNTEELIYLRQKIDFECKIFPLVSQSRRLVKCGELTALDYSTLSPKWKVTTRPIYLHLFNDRLLLSRPREGGRFVVFDHAAFSDVRGEKCEMKLHGANKNVFRLFLFRNNQGKRVEFLFRTETHSEKLRWISALAPPQGEPDLLESPDSPQVQCIRTYKARENDELALEKADIIMVMQNSNDGWMEGVKLSDGERGWFPSEHVELISSKHARQMNLKEEQRVKNAKQQVFCKK